MYTRSGRKAFDLAAGHRERASLFAVLDWQSDGMQDDLLVLPLVTLLPPACRY